ncbi:midnolin homolog [Leptidea sinapis]|uniref:midnolin homolog n=1 Tax=Leptidea sinapis TaxID=189913 RepID=UPI002141AE11|nr:midnolin homolog [Leptidea sinapis]
MERATGTEVFGCGSTHSSDITLNIQTTTGGNFSISVNCKNSIDHLKKLVSRKLKVSKERLCLLYRERQLIDGTLEENGLLDGSRIILLPSVETGLLSQRSENSVMQALETLNDNQVNDFLSGRSPLNLTMRLGDHMMLIQLQLSTLNSSSASSSINRSLKTSTPLKVSKEESSDEPVISQMPCSSHNTGIVNENGPVDDLCISSGLDKQDLDLLHNAFDLYRTMAEAEKYAQKVDSSPDKEDVLSSSNCTLSDLTDTSVESEQSPIKSLSNLVSSPLHSTSDNQDVKAIANSVKNSLLDLLSNKSTNDVAPSTSASCDKKVSPDTQTTGSVSDDDGEHFAEQSSFLTESTIDEYPMENLFNNAVDKGLFTDQDETMMDREISNLATTSHGTHESTPGSLPPFQSISEISKNKRFQYLLHKTSKFKHPIGQNKQKAFINTVNKNKKSLSQSNLDSTLPQPSTSKAEAQSTNSTKKLAASSQTDISAIPSTSQQNSEENPVIDSKALKEASRSLTHKLRKLSKEVLTKKIDLKTLEQSVRSKISPGAVIESMKHHGRGIYSGTFSGTLNPALQDRFGRPKRDISTIIHILNDLLCATPPLIPKEVKHTCPHTSINLGSGDNKKCPICIQASCSCGQCNGHLPSGSRKSCTCNKDCQCNRLNPPLCQSCEAKGDLKELCPKCTTARTFAIENTKTKCKLEQLKLVMQQKKERREARKMKTLPYATPTKPIPTPEQEEIGTTA